MNAVTLAVSKISRAGSRFLKRRNRANKEHEDPLVQVTDNEATQPTDRDEPETKNMPLVYCCCRQWAWPAVTFRCATHPHEAHVSIRDKNGDTALHWTCIGKPPIDTVEALLTACPELASATNYEGQLPLHGKYRTVCAI